jgi:hypothetical protein
MTASTRSPESLGSIGALRRRVQALAVLDLLLLGTPEHKLVRVRDLELAGRENGQGDDVLVVFTPRGALVRGFDHESSMSPYNEDVALAHLTDDEVEELDPAEEAELLQAGRPFRGVLDPVPPDVQTLLEQLDHEPDRPVAIPSVLTFCLWRGLDDAAWQVGPIDFPEGDDPDGSAYLLAAYSQTAPAYQTWLADYLGRPIPLELVEAVFAHRPLTLELAALAESSRSLEELRSAARELGYAEAPGS